MVNWAALIGVDDLGRAVLRQGLLDGFLGMDRLQRDRHRYASMRQATFTTVEEYMKPRHRDVRRA